MAEAYIVEAVRTPVGKRGGGLSGIHSAGVNRERASRRRGVRVRRYRLVDGRVTIDPAAVVHTVAGLLSSSCQPVSGVPVYRQINPVLCR